MISKLWHLAVKMLLVKKGRTFFSILAIALGVGLLCAMFQMHKMFNQDTNERMAKEYGSALIGICSPMSQSERIEWNDSK